MLRNIGIIGYGFVGKGTAEVFKHNTEILVIDPAHKESISYLDLVRQGVRAVFVCVPVPTNEDRTLDTSILCSVLDNLIAVNYTGIVVVKSTMTPNVINEIYAKYANDKLFNKVGPLNLIYSPEFLRESHWLDDALNPRIIILGGEWSSCKEIQFMYEHNGTLRTHPRFFITSMVEASLVKYTINTFLALKVTFFNQLYKYYSDFNEGKEPHPEMWEDFVEMVSSDMRMGHTHMKVPGPDGKYGYGGTCFPKDVKAFIGSDKNGHLTVLRDAELANTKIRLTDTPGDSNNS